MSKKNAVPSSERQAELVAKAKEGDREAMAGVCESQKGLVKQLALSYGKQSIHVELDDMIQEGYCAVMDAVRWFDAGRGYKFSTYAGDCIRKRLFKYLQRRDVVPIGSQETQTELEGLDGIEEIKNSYGGNLEELLLNLPPQRRAIVRKALGIAESIEGVEETAEKLGIPPNEVKRETVVKTATKLLKEQGEIRKAAKRKAKASKGVLVNDPGSV